MSTVNSSQGVPAAAHASISLDSTVGALEISILICYAFWGVLTMQVVLYMRNFQDDSWKLRYLVMFTWVVEVLQCAFLGHGIYTVTVTYFGLLVPKPTPWSLNAAVILNGVIGAVAQSYSTYRIYLIAGYLPVTIICWSLAIVRMVGVVAIGIIAIKLQFLNLLITNWRWLLIATTSLGGFVDVLIAVALCFSLWRTNRGFEDLKRIIDKITMLAIETGLLSSVLGIAIPISFAYADTTFAWLALFLVLSKVFSNSLLASLNLREVYRKELTRKSASTQFARPRRTFPFLEPNRVEIEMCHTTMAIHDEDQDQESRVLDLKCTPTTGSSIRFPPSVLHDDKMA